MPSFEKMTRYMEMVVLSVISRAIDATAKLSTIAKIRKYRRFHEGHHFIPMAMEVHNAPKHDMDRFIRECACLFHDKQSRGHLSFFFYIQFFRHNVNIALQCALISFIKRKIALACDVCSKPPITIRSHDLHVGDIRRAMGEITSYQKD
jgi:hypothetical protein